MPAPAFDLQDAARAAVRLFWLDFAPLVIGGFLLVTLPGIAAHLIGLDAPDTGTAGTVGETSLAVLLMLYLAIASFGGLARLRHRPLPLGPYLRGGLAAARPGLIAALVIGVAIMLGVILIVLARGHPIGWLARAATVVTLAWALTMWIAAIPAAVAERLPPFEALRRSAALTKGVRGRVFALMAVAVLALLPGAILVDAVVYGPDADAARAQAVIAAMTLTHPGLWIAELYQLLAVALLASIPPVVYHELAAR